MNKKSLAYSGALLLALIFVSLLVNKGMVRAILNPGDVTLSTTSADNSIGTPRVFTGTLSGAALEEFALNGVQLVINHTATASTTPTTTLDVFLPSGFTTTPVTTTLTVVSQFGTHTLAVYRQFTNIATTSEAASTLPGTTFPGSTLPGGPSQQTLKGISTGANIFYRITWTSPVHGFLVGKYTATLTAHLASNVGAPVLVTSNTVGFNLLAALSLSVANATVDEGISSGVATISVTLVGRGGTVSVDVVATKNLGTALADTDYTPASTTLTWQQSDTTDTKTVSVPIIDDALEEDAETVTDSSAKRDDYTATLWLNDLIEETRAVPIGSGQTVSVTFQVTPPVGNYDVRVGRQLASFAVQTEPTPTPTATVTPTPTQTPTATPVPPTPRVVAAPPPSLITVTPSPEPPTATPTPPPSPPAPVVAQVPTPTHTPTAVATAVPPTVVPPTPPIEEVVEEGGSPIVIIIVGVVVVAGIAAGVFFFLRSQGTSGGGPSAGGPASSPAPSARRAEETSVAEESGGGGETPSDAAPEDPGDEDSDSAADGDESARPS